jgi:hypothetical protein
VVLGVVYAIWYRPRQHAASAPARVAATPLQ